MSFKVTKNLRKHNFSGEVFVEFFGPGVQLLSVADRSAIANMCSEYGSLIGYFPLVRGCALKTSHKYEYLLGPAGMASQNCNPCAPSLPPTSCMPSFMKGLFLNYVTQKSLGQLVSSGLISFNKFKDIYPNTFWKNCINSTVDV